MGSRSRYGRYTSGYSAGDAYSAGGGYALSSSPTTTGAYTARYGNNATNLGGSSSSSGYNSTSAAVAAALGGYSSSSGNDYGSSMSAAAANAKSATTLSNSYGSSSPARRRYTGAYTDSSLADMTASLYNNPTSSVAGLGTATTTTTSPRTASASARAYRGARSHQDLTMASLGLADTASVLSSPKLEGDWRLKTSDYDTYRSSRPNSNNVGNDPDSLSSSPFRASRNRSSARAGETTSNNVHVNSGLTNHLDTSYSATVRDRDPSLGRDSTASLRDRYPSGTSRDDFGRDFETYGGMTRTTAYSDSGRDNEYYIPPPAPGRAGKRPAAATTDTLLNGSSPLAPQRFRREDFRSRTSYDQQQRFENAAAAGGGIRAATRAHRAGTGGYYGSGLVRSNSFRDLRDLEADIGGAAAAVRSSASSRTLPRNRARHQTLAYGVSAADLGLANSYSQKNLLAELAEWRAHNVPIVGGCNVNSNGGNVNQVSSNSNSRAPDLRGFASDMSVGPNTSLGGDNRGATNASSAGAGAGAHRPAGSKSQNGGEVDYKKLWEESQKENSRLRDDVNKMRDDLSTTKRKMDTLQASASASSSSNSGLSDSEKREKKALEKKLSEMEEELKQLEHLKNDNQRLRDENGALIRVISKLSK